MNPNCLLPNIQPAYLTQFGSSFCGNSLDLLRVLPDNSINLVITSPPFALLREKDYGNESQKNYLEWLSEFAKLVLQKLTIDGSFVLDIGGAYQKKFPIRSLYNFKIPIMFVEEIGFFLAEDFYWFNPSKLPSPIEWVNKRKIRVKDAVNNVWWFSKSEFPKADVKKVLVPYSERMKKLIEDPEAFFKPKKRPSGHDIGMSFGKDNGGAIPSNLLSIPNTESNGLYVEYCNAVNIKPHSARFPSKLPQFFINFLTDENDIVLDIFAGSNTTGEVAERMDRRWLAFELDKIFTAASSFRFIPKGNVRYAREVYHEILQGKSIHLESELKMAL